MQREKDVPPPPCPGQQSARADRQLALQLREDALATLGDKLKKNQKQNVAVGQQQTALSNTWRRKMRGQ